VWVFSNVNGRETLHERVSAVTNDVCFYENVPATVESSARRKHGLVVTEAIFHWSFAFNQTGWKQGRHVPPRAFLANACISVRIHWCFGGKSTSIFRVENYTEWAPGKNNSNIVDAVCSYETWVNFYWIICRHIEKIPFVVTVIRKSNPTLSQCFSASKGLRYRIARIKY
jgi:hypothetical protein